MRRITILAMCMTVLFSLVACADSDGTNETGSTRDYSFMDKEEGDGLDRYIHTVATYDKDKKGISGDKNYYYDGSPYETYFEFTNEREEKMIVTVVALLDGNIQEYMVGDDGEKVYDYMFEVKGEESYVLHVKLDPMAACIDKPSRLEYIELVKFVDSQTNEVKHVSMYSLHNRRIYAKEEADVRDGKNFDISTAAIEYDLVDYLGDNGVDLSLSIEESKESNQAIEIIEKGKDDLYIKMYGQGDNGEGDKVKENTVFLFCDGRLIKAIDGKYQGIGLAGEKVGIAFKVDENSLTEGEHVIQVIKYPYSYVEKEKTDDLYFASNFLSCEYNLDVK